jgi:putative NADH-flavin reductase
MRLFVLGATGRTGLEFLDLALARGHAVTAFVRSPDKIVQRSGLLSVVKGNVLEPKELATALRDHDAVVSALGPRLGQALRNMPLMEDSAASTVEAMQTAQVKRLLVVSAALLFDEGGLAVNFFRSVIGRHVRDLRAMEAIIRPTSLDWTIARPPRLVQNRNERYRALHGGMPEPLSATSTMSWRAVAAFLLHAAETQSHVRQVVGLVADRSLSASKDDAPAPAR